MKKYALFLAVLLITVTVACGNNSRESKSQQSKSQQSKSVKNCVKVFYFHGKQRCATCKAIETLTKEVLDSDFAKEQKSGKIIFKVIDISQKKNEAIAEKYEVAWSSLILDKVGKVVNLTDMGFSYAKGQPEVFKRKFKEEITKLLK